MLSDIVSISSNASLNPQQSTNRIDIYQIVRIGNKEFRVFLRQYQTKSSMIIFWCVFWIASTCNIAAILLTNLIETSINILFFSFIFFSIIFTIFALYLRKKLEKIMLFSIINLSFLAIIAFIMLITKIYYTIIVVSVLVFNQLIASAIYIRNKGKIVLQLILLVELAMISAKVDNQVNISWTQVLIPLIPFFVFLASAFTFILIYTILLKCYYKQTFEKKKLSLIFLLLNLWCFTSILAIPLSWSFFQANIIAFCILAMGGASTNSIFLWIYHQQITLNFCQYKHQILQSEKEIKIELIPITNQRKQKPIFRLSQNWFGNQIKEQVQFSQISYPQCLVCTERLSDIVWLPCGHLSLCTYCCKDVINNKMISCILCKQKPTRICKIKQKDEIQSKLDREMGIINQLNKAQTIVQDYEVRIS